MPLRNARPVTIKPAGLSDSDDGTNAFPGAMAVLQNLIPNPGTKNQFVCRPAAQQITNFSGFVSPAGVTALLVVGARVYGMISSGLNAGKDQPFCYDLVNGAFVNITNITAANTPTTPFTTGDWTPPTMEMIANRVIITHPGYDGVTHFVGWIDVRNYTSSFLLGNTSNGSNVIQSINDGGTSDPIADGVQVGDRVTGTGIPINTFVTSLASGTFDLNTTGTTNGTTTVSAVANLTGVQVGMAVTGVGFAAGTYVEALPGGGVVTLNQAAINSVAGTAINFSGGGTITLSNNATASNNLVALTIASGTTSGPVYGAGQTSGFGLTAVPAAVTQFNGRAYYAVNNGVQFSDSLIPLNITNADQALTLGDASPVTALAGIPLANQVTGGTVQSIIAFKGAGPYWQITGDPATNNLALNLVAGTMGTLAPNSICTTPKGVSYMAQDGLRIIGLNGQASDPIGVNGQGVCVPFLNAIYPTRMCAAYNHNIVRLSVQNGTLNGDQMQEYWYDMTLQIWTGPHTFPAALIVAYDGNPVDTFIEFASGVNAALWQSDCYPQLTSGYTENGTALSWVWQPCLSPDNSLASMNALSRMLLGMELPAVMATTVVASDEQGNVLDQITLSGAGAAGSIWGSFDWGVGSWGAANVNYQQHEISWHQPLVFKQMSLRVVGSSMADFSIGNLYFEFQPLGYPVI